MAKDRIFFLLSFAILGLVAAFVLRGNEKPPASVTEAEQPKLPIAAPASVPAPAPNEAVTAAPVPQPRFNVIPIEDGKRAVPFELSARSAIIQFMYPGMYVDVEFSTKADQGFGAISVTLIRNARILAIGNSPEGRAYNQTGGVYKSNTPVEILLEMSPREAEVFHYAEGSGVISLALMNTKPTHVHEELVEMLLKSDSVGDFHSVLVTYMMRSLFPTSSIKILATKKGYIVSGKVPDPQMAGKIMEILTKMTPEGDKTIVNLIEADPQLVLLRVKVFEVTKDIQARLGVNWEFLFQQANEVIAFGATFPRPLVTDPNFFLAGEGIRFGDWTLSYLVDMLQEDGMARVLAEPNLTTVSGTTAHFFAGGEFPILIPQGGTLAGTVTVEYKKYGVLLDFTPFVDVNGLVTMHVVPEVSTLDRNNGVILAGFVIPGIISRRVDTVVKLWPGQSYIIGGLLQNESLNIDDHLFGLSKLPVIGPLFSSKRYRDHKTELMVIVTPYLLTSEKPNYDYDASAACETPWCETPWEESCNF